MVKIYKRPVCIVEDILHLEIVISSVNQIHCYFKQGKLKEKKNTYRLFEEAQWYKYFTENTITELTISSFLAKWKVKKAETYMLFQIQAMLLSATSRKGQQDPDLHPV